MNDPASAHPFWDITAPPADVPEDVSQRTPFVAEIRRQGSARNGSFVPSARLVLTPALRTGGLWHALPGEEIKTLLLLLTFLTPDGTCRPAVAEMAPAMRLPEPKARARLERLAAFRWQGNPVVRELRRDSGLHAFVPALGVLAAAESPPEAPIAAAEAPLARPAGREAVIAHSRTLYARPRADVEREMAARMGWEDPEALRLGREREEAALTDEGRGLLARLLGLGVERAKALELLAAHAPDGIRRQADWLPLRGAKNPARFLAAAIQGDYAPPAGLRSPGMKPGTQAPGADGARAQEEDPQKQDPQEDGPAADTEQALPAEQALPTLDARALHPPERHG